MQEAAFRGNRYRALIYQAGRGRTDWIQPICMGVLCVMGVFFIYSAQVYSGQSLWIRQVVWIVLGAGVYIAVSLLDYKILLEKAHLIYFGSVVLLLLLWTPFGGVRFDSRRWLDLGVASFQPSEAAKIGVLVMVSSLLARSEVGSVRESVSILVKVGIVVGGTYFVDFLATRPRLCIGNTTNGLFFIIRFEAFQAVFHVGFRVVCAVIGGAGCGYVPVSAFFAG